VWLTSEITDYSFEVAIATSWVPKSGYYSVNVVDKKVDIAIDASGKPVEDFTLTVDGIWDGLLAARAIGQLNSARFNSRGVPIETDWGPWPVDGGVHYSVRRFVVAP
jgi:hypothetical protein